MTIRDKFLKDGVSVEEFVEFLKSKQPNNKYDMTFYDIALWLNTPIKPTLTKDERVILRNMPQKEWNYIFRDNMGNIQFEHLKVNGAPNSIGRADWYNHLFQFIKERRRILYRGTFERRMIDMIKVFAGIVIIFDILLAMYLHYKEEYLRAIYSMCWAILIFVGICGTD